jgi:predicted RNA-binding protein YlqC (UPF0109 family)
MLKSDVGANLKELLKQVVKRLVDNPDQVELSEKEGSMSLVIEVSTAKEDVGKLIGRHGANIGAVRTLVASAAGKHGKRVYVEVKEPERIGRV